MKDFKTLITKIDLIPRIELLLLEEEEHLSWLKDNDAPKDFIKTSEKALLHYMERTTQYTQYNKKRWS